MRAASRGQADTGRTPPAVSILHSAAQQERYEERAAIMEFDGGLTRAEAERRAREEVYGDA
jgi:hypothetical protein